MASAKDISINPGHVRWFRLEILLEYYGKEVLKKIFHRNIRAPDNGTKDLYDFLLKFKNTLQIYPEERIKLFPPSGITYEEEFDISLFGRIIRTILCIYCKNKNNDFSQQDLIHVKKDINFTNMIMNWRNTLYHEGDKDITEIKFEEWWYKILSRLSSQTYCPVDMASVSDLKDGDIFSNNKYQGRAQFLLCQGRVVLFTYFPVENNSGSLFFQKHF